MQPPVPPAFLVRMQRLLGDEYAAFASVYDSPPVSALRVNTLKTEPAALAARLPFALAPVPWSDEAFLLSEPDVARPGKHPYHAAGLYYLQDPSALVPVILLDPQPGERVLDLSAAPGGKATHIAARLQGKGVLVANEVVHKRAWELAGNLERWGATNVAITAETPERLAERWPGVFDAVLLDAPCSGEGMFRKSAAARQDWSPALVEGCAVRQGSILDAAAQLVRPGGRLVYSTCTFAPEEDEGALAAFLGRHPDFELVGPRAQPGFDPGRPDWLSEGRADLQRAVRVWPHHGPGEGHFAALLRRTGAAADPQGVPGRRRAAGNRGGKTAQSSASALTAFARWCIENLARPLSEQPVIEGAYLYALPPGLPDLSGLRTIHAGRWLGELKGGRFEPSHALALAMAPADVQRAHDLSVDDPAVLAYLHGEVLEGAGDDGYVLMTVDGYSLGWGRRVGGRIKNLYPKGLRWN